MPTRLFVPSPDHFKSSPRVDEADEVRDVIALITLKTARATTELVIGLDAGRVIRVVATRALPPRPRAQVDFHERARPRIVIEADELYVMDVQAVEHQPDAPGADDPLYLYGVLRGPYPDGVTGGVAGVEGQLATTRGPLLDGLVCGTERSFLYESGACGTTCTHAALPIDSESATRSVVLAFPLVTMGDDGSNELVAAQLVHDVLGAMRIDLGDDLSVDPVPVPSRASYERELTAAGWTIKGETAIHSGGKGRFASLFAAGKKQKMPRQVKLVELTPLVHAALARLPGWPEPARGTLHERLGFRTRQRPPTPPIPISVNKRAPTQPPPIPAPRSRPPPPEPAIPHTTRRRAATNHSMPPPPKHKQKSRTVVAGLTAPKPKEWIRALIEDHHEPNRPRPHVTTPARVTGDDMPDWMFDPIDPKKK